MGRSPTPEQMSELAAEHLTDGRLSNHRLLHDLRIDGVLTVQLSKGIGQRR
jgi:hypothetical protein